MRPPVAIVLLLLASTPSAAGETWTIIKGDIFGETPIVESSSIITLTAPTRAQDAALVPIEVHLSAPAGRTIEAVTLVVDENPSPVAATFRFGPGRREANLATRLRVDAYSNVRAVAKTDDGALHMAVRFVKASGGCSAPALKDADEALARLGEMRLKRISTSEAQVMIRHPNYSGLQMNPLTRHYIPARFVNSIIVRQGDELVFEMEGGISLSEDPTIRFTYAGTDAFAVRAEDTEQKVFEHQEETAPTAGRGT